MSHERRDGHLSLLVTACHSESLSNQSNLYWRKRSVCVFQAWPTTILYTHPSFDGRCFGGFEIINS